MKKVDLGQTVSILANLGVVAGLLLLVVEINQSNRQAEANAAEARLGALETSMQQFAISPELPGIYVKVRESGLESLSSEELDRLASWESARMVRLIGQHEKYVRGLLDEVAYERTVRFTARRVDIWKRLNLEMDNADFLAAIEAIYPTVQPITDRELSGR